MFVVSHRGSFQKAPQNSLKAFHQSIKDECQRIEMDLQLAQDGSVWISHDDMIFDINGKIKNISQMTCSELNKTKLISGDFLPRLEDVLSEILPYIELNLELKGPKASLADHSCKIINQGSWASMKERIIFSSFDIEPLLVLKKDYPEFKRALLTETTYCWAPQRIMDFLGCTIIHPQIDQIDKHFMEYALHRGWQVVSWAPVKSVEDYGRHRLWSFLLELGVHGHCTNYPYEMIQFLKLKNGSDIS